jgi:hypothetical protein
MQEELVIVSALEKICGARSPTNILIRRSNRSPLFVQKMLSPSLFADLRLFHVHHAQTIE